MSENETSTSDKDDDSGSAKDRRKITIMVVATVLVLGIVAGIGYYFYQKPYVTTDDAFIDGQIVRITAQQTGRLTEVAVEGNARVQEGDLLARLDDATITAQLASARAQVAESEAATAEANAAIKHSEAAAEGARSQRDAARVAAQNARTKADRYDELAEKSGQTAVSVQSLDDLNAAARQAEAEAATAQTGVTTAEADVAASNARLQSAQARLAAAKAGVQQTQVEAAKLEITAPIDGQIVQVNVNTGSYVTPGMQVMALVPDDLFVTANFKETQLRRIRPGQKVEIEVDAFPDVEFRGTVQSIQHGAGQAFQLLPPQNATGNFVKVVQRVPVRISIDSPPLSDFPIGPGMSVVPRIRPED
ncbi:hypothetical protein DC366_16525 [Pelagivirga sediminicola]|uniref:Uncharacterized protein n=1 Tax=Pelagivirga sediminicola TaxID=2170575 RepID=A0A2T7G3A8_9RHOB|nr:HlyD family secretion protein [Pelagivirga sediminicola]PVA08903.1 hypothetical protein DC366_16525 [Pelagivirga sediminicola]